MSIIEDLDLLDLPDDLPDGLDFDLDDILFEFSTPGLYAPPEPEDEPLPEIIEENNEEEPAPMEAPEIVTETAEDFFAVPEEEEGEEKAEEEETAEAQSEELPAEEDEDVYHGDLFGDPFGISDILYEFGTPTDDEGVKVYSPAKKEQSAPEEDDIKVYAPAKPVEAPEAELPLETIRFDAVEEVSPETMPFTAVEEADDLASVSFTADTTPFAAVEDAPVPAVEAPKSKGPGPIARLMGLFAGKKKQPAHTMDRAAAASAQEDPFAHAAELFAEQNALLDDELDSSLMLELELMAEMEAERDAKAAAWEAEERIISEPEPVLEVPEAIAVLQQEADEEAARAEREAAELLAAQEAERLAQAEEELFEWIESTNKYRGKAISKEELPVFESEPQEEDEDDVRTYVPMADTEEGTPAAEMPMLDITEDEAPAFAPDMTDEESDPEILSLLENPDTERETGTEESDEEAAARRAKADEELRYTPDEPTVKAIGSHIGKRFGAMFSVFTAAAKDSDDEEALGAEVTPTKAYRYFNKYINGYRFRLRLSAVLCVIMGWIALGLPVFGSLKNPAAASAMCLMLLLTIMLAGADILASGVQGLIKRRPGIHSLVTVSCLVSVIDAIVIIACKGEGGYLPFCAVSGISMCFAIYGSLLYCRSQRLNFKTLEQCAEPLTISVDYGIVDDETTTVYRTIGHPESYIHRSEEEDLSETVYGLLTPMLMLGTPVLTLLAALLSKGFGDFFHILAAMFAASASFSALVAFPLPYFLVQRELYATKSAIAGWAGTKDIGRVSTMIVTDRDLFPDETVSIKSVRIVDEVNPDLTLSYFCSMIKRSGSCLVPAFDQLAENNDCELREVENFQCHEAGGLSGTIGPDEVLIASHSYMKLQGFRIPARKKDSENALFMAANGHVIAYIVVDYKPIKSVRTGLESALRGSAEMVFAARDFNITPLLISKKFKSPTDTLRFPSYAQRYEITDNADSDTAVCAAVVSRKSFFSYAAVVEKARYLYRSVTMSVALSAVSSLMGVLLMFIMALTGAGAAVTVGRLLIFMLLWLVPTLALTVSITK